MREYTGTMARSSPGSVGVQASVARTTKSARTVPPEVVTHGGSPGLPGPDVEHLGVLVDPHPVAFDRIGQAPGQERRLHHRAVGREGGADRPFSADDLGGLLGAEPAHVVLAEPEGARLVDFGQSPGPAEPRSGRGRPNRP